MFRILACIIFFFSGAVCALSTDQYFDSIKNDPQRLMIFLKKMPKGAELHTHADGATYAENLIAYAQKDNFCLTDQFAAVKKENCPPQQQLSQVSTRFDAYNQLINAWSMRKQPDGSDTHFFDTFGKFLPVSGKYLPSILAEMANRAADQNVSYLETMLLLPDEYASGLLGKKIQWNDNFAVMQEQLMSLGLLNLAKTNAAQMTQYQTELNQKMQCGTPNAQSGCGVKMRFIYPVLRNMPSTEVFSQLVTAFNTLKLNPTAAVGINMVQAENGVYSMQDYKLHMQMINFLKKEFPEVKVTLHAGELIPRMVPPEGLKSHIRDAIEIGQAKRIGHGVSVAYEQNADELLKKMAKEKILVEINLTSNKSILGVDGKTHPLSLYLAYGVPVALSTDDEGVLRTNITQEYFKAAYYHSLSYAALKTMARNSITYSFLPAEEKAQLEKDLDKAFIEFEKQDWRV